MMSNPVILGSSLTGLLISRSLSRAGIDHTVIGGQPPATTPRLGESANEGASVMLWDLLGREFQPYFRAKKHVSLSWGDFTGMISISDPDQGLDDLNERDPSDMGFLDIGPRLVHVDRAHLDPALYAAVRADPRCRFIEGTVADIHIDEGADRVEAIVLDDGTRLHPSSVFDATGHRSLVGTALGVKRSYLEPLQRVVWRHRTRSGAPGPFDRDWWHCGTNLVRLDASTDGIKGIAWVIPMHDSVSIGVSVDGTTHDESTLSSEALIDLLESALQSRGIAVVDSYPAGSTIQSFVHRYYMRERAYGANWMLAGSTFGQIWFPTSTGLSTSTMAAYLAPAFLRHAESVGSYYEHRFRILIPFHSLASWILKQRSPRDYREMYDFWAEWLEGVLERAPHDLRIASGRSKLPLPLFRAFTSLIGRRTWSLLMFMGFLRIRVERTSVPGTNPFPQYFNPRRFLFDNVRRGLTRYLMSSLQRLPFGRLGARRGDEPRAIARESSSTGSHSLSSVGMHSP